jgi:CBS domain-containing protein
MITAGRLLDEKGHEVWPVGPNDTVFDAIKLMENKHVGALAVLEGEKLIGIVSELMPAKLSLKIEPQGEPKSKKL